MPRRASRAILIFTLLVFLLPATRIKAATRPVYVVRGTEALAILPLLDDATIRKIQPGGLQAVLTQNPVTALVMPGDQADKDDPDWQAAQTAAIPVRLMLRHTTVASILTNIRILGDLTGSQPAAARLMYRIADGLARIRDQVQLLAPVRVLVLSPEGYTQGQGAFITELIERAGGINVAAEAGIPEARQIEDSRIRDLAPQVILLIGWTAEQAGAFASGFPYKDVPAFAAQRLYRIEQPGKDVTRLVMDVMSLVRLFHP